LCLMGSETAMARPSVYVGGWGSEGQERGWRFALSRIARLGCV